MAVKIVCRKGLYVYKGADEGIYFKRIYSFDPPLHIYTINSTLASPVSALHFSTNTTTGRVCRARVYPHNNTTKTIYLTQSNFDVVNFQNVPFDGIYGGGVSVQWVADPLQQVQPNYILNPMLTNPTSYDSCMISWAYKNTNFTFLNKK